MTPEALENFRLQQIEALVRCAGYRLQMAATAKEIHPLARLLRILGEQAPSPFGPRPAKPAVAGASASHVGVAAQAAPGLTLGPVILSEAIAVAVELWELRGMAPCLRLRWLCEIDTSTPVWGSATFLQQVFFHLFLRAEQTMASAPRYDGQAETVATLRSNVSGDCILAEFSYGGESPMAPPTPAQPSFRLCRALLELMGGSIRPFHPQNELPWNEGLALLFPRFPQLGSPAMRSPAWSLRSSLPKVVEAAGKIYQPRVEKYAISA